VTAATVLVAEDSLVIRAVLRGHLEEEGYDVMEAEDGDAALACCQSSPPDAILLDIEMPGLNGHQVLAQLKGDESLRDIPVVFLTGRTGSDDLITGLRAGAHDYLKKPFETAELLARIGAAVRVKRLQDQLRERNQELDRLGRLDGLTGVYNRRHLEEQLLVHHRAAQRHGRPLTVLMLDLDHFKQINDSYGHAGGDTVLRTVTGRLQGLLRGGDIIGRWGGEEFLLILPDTPDDAAAALAERVRSTIGGAPVELGECSVPVTPSGGSATGDEDPDALTRRADEALYRAKSAGRNRILAAAPPVLRGTATRSGRLTPSGS
jgi:two-component system cell cycle response regulator